MSLPIVERMRSKGYWKKAEIQELCQLADQLAELVHDWERWPQGGLSVRHLISRRQMIEREKRVT